MMNRFLYPQRMLRTVLFVLLLSAAGMTKAQNENITFADANVKALCVANWDTNGDGELSQAEAAAVTSLGGVFMFDDGITTFNELWLFTGLTSIGEDEFNSCTNLTAISIPDAVTYIGNYAFSDCSSLTSLTSYACTPPTMGNNVFDNVPSAMVINVPCHTSAMYQAAEGWSDFSNYVEFEYGLCPIPFVDDNVKAICVAHWDTNGDGELSYAEAAAVTNLGTHFKSTAITSFDELEYFTSLTSIPNTAFYGCTSLASITLPSSVSTLGNGSFYNCTNLATMTVYAETPPTVGTNAFKNVPTSMVVNVPCGTIEAYQNANGWSGFTNIQQSGACPIVFADANVKAICVANWDTNGDGELSYDEAAAVTDLGTIFKNNTNITSFDELQYFAGLSSIGYQAFYRCSALTSIIIPNPVISIDGYAFEGCSGLTSIEIPNSVTSIGDYAFYYCNGLTSVEIPSSVASLGTNSFGNCRILEQIMVDPSNAYFDSRENCNAVIKTNTNELVVGCKNTIIPNSVTSIGFCAFYCCQGLTSLEIPNSVISIGGYAFRYCTGLTSVTLGNSVTSIGHSAFDNCTGLTSIEIPNSVISIGYNAFFNCTGLTSLTFGNSLASIGNSAFYWCTGLTSMTVLSDNPPTIGNNAFYNVSTNIPVYVPCGAVEDYQVTNGWNSFTYITGLCSGEVLVSVNPTGGGLVTGGGYYAGGDVCVLTATPNQGFVFANWTENGRIVSLDSVYSFHAHPTTIVANFCSNSPIVFADTNVKALCVTHWDINGDGELSYAEAAMVIDIGDVFKNNSSIISFNELQYFINLTSIGFYNCTGLTSIEIPNSVTSIGDGAFYNCNSLTSINIPNSVTLIDGYAFEYCTSLTSVEIPNSVFLIGDNPFIGCSSLEQIMVASDNAYYDSRENCNAIIRTSTNILVAGCKNTVIPNSVVSIRNHAFYRCSGLTSIEIPNSVTSIGNSAFSSCTGLTSVVIPNSVISIGFQTFINCSSLTSVTIGNSVTSIDSYAFNHCSGLTTIISFAETPPIIDNTVFYSVNKSIPVYVPNGTISAYQSASGWIEFTNIQEIGPSPITFADANVKALCVANWDTNNDGELSYDEAAAVTDLGQVFTNKSWITSFDELQYFTGLTYIGNSAFNHCDNLTSIQIPNSVTTINHQAFSYCHSLSSLTFGNSLTVIGDYTFYDCDGLTGTLHIPNSVTTIGWVAFAQCDNITAVSIGNSVNSISSQAFSGCLNLGQIVIDSDNTTYDSRNNCNAIIETGSSSLISGCKNTVIPNTVTSIGQYAFSSCRSLTSIVIPNSITSIGDGAFQQCTSLTSITIPCSVTAIGTNAFLSCFGLEQIVVASENPVYDSRENCNAIIKTNSNALVTGCKNTVIPNTVTSIGSNAFRECVGLTSIEIPNSIASIGYSAFYDCTGLKFMNVLSETPPTLGDYMFHYVSTNIPIYVPCDAVEAYQADNGWNRFTNIIGMCSGEVSVTANPTDGGAVTGAGNYVDGDVCVLSATPNSGYSFGNWTENGLVVSMDPVFSFYAHPTTLVANFCSNNPIIFADANVKAICVANWDTNGDGELSYAEAATVTDLGEVFKGNSAITSFDELQYFIGLTSIGSWAFRLCYNLTSVVLPKSLTLINDCAFSECYALTSIDIPTTVTVIGVNAFHYCTGLTSIELPNSVTLMNTEAFHGCSGLTSIKLSNSLTSISSLAFHSCSSLTSIEIPNSVSIIGSSAFYGCSHLISITVLADNPPALGNNAFYNVNKSIPVYVPCGTSNIYQNSEGWSEFTNYIEMCPGTITITASPTEGGTVTGGGSYEGGGATCTLTATANHDYCFLNWTENGEVVSYNAEYTFLVTGDRNLVANFSFIPPAPVVAEYYPDSNEPNSPYVIVHWAVSSFEAMIGDEASSAYTAYMPFFTLYDNSISEALYTAGELIEAGATAGPITSLSWEAVSVTTNQPQNNISIWMANVTDTELTTTSHLASNMTLVYTGNIGIPPMGWNEFVFNESNFVWDGTSNVLILCQRNNGQWNGSVYWRSHNPGFYGMAYKYRDGTPYDVTSQTYALTLSNTARPNIIMKGEGTMTYNLYRANCDGTDAQLIAENLSDTQYIDETWWRLENDSYKYGVSIADSTNTDIFWSNCIEKQGNMAAQTVTLSQGINWFSTYLEITLDDLKAALVEALPNASETSTIIIKSQRSGQTTYNGTRWRGALNTLDFALMYQITVPESCEITLVGMPIDPTQHPVTIKNGPNWIGFPFSANMTPTDAFAGFAINGDQISSKTQKATYNTRWRGALTNLVPGQGYIYNSAAAGERTLIFPTTAK